AGRDYVLVETVGVGQTEIDIASLAHAVVVVLAPGMGDDIQTIKAGILEIADILVVNKADLPGTEALERELEGKIVRTVATDGIGIPELLDALVGQAPRPVRDRPGGLPHKIDHIGIAVRSLDQALPFYEHQLGLQPSIRETIAQEKVNVAMLPANIELL